jgi:hypothetical protein
MAYLVSIINKKISAEVHNYRMSKTRILYRATVIKHLFLNHDIDISKKVSVLDTSMFFTRSHARLGNIQH